MRVYNMAKKGFTLIEIMIVIAIIALLAAIAIPNLLRVRLHSNEATAQAALKTIVSAEVAYRISNPTYGTLEELGTPGVGPPYIDKVLADGIRNGYQFISTDITAETFNISAVPVSLHNAGFRSFCATQDGVVRVQADGSVIADYDACLALPPTSP